jgi:N-acetylglucosamine-6-phosphate deacetylase
MKIQIHDGYVLLPSGIRKTDVEIDSGRIASLGKLTRDPQAVHLAATGRYVLPGFIDLHANGIAGFDLTHGEFDASTGKFSRKADFYIRGFERALTAFALKGTTLLGFTILEAPIEQLKKIFKLIACYREEHTCFHNDMFFGIYIEGTFMKEEASRGAHNPKYYQTPSVRLFKKLQSAAKGHIRIVNVVPEWGKPALTLIQYLSSQGIVCATGHSGATGAQYQSAIDKGSTLAIHVMNGPSSSSAKPFHGGGVLETLLRSDRVYAEIIADGFHVDKHYVMDIIERKGIDKCVVVTDSMFVSGMKSMKEFQMSGIKGRVSKGGKYLQIADRGDALYGSVLTMDKAFQNVMNWFMMPMPGIWNRHHRAHTFDEALFNTSQLCSASAAKALGIYEPSTRGLDHNLSCGTGDITVGKRADLVVANIQRQRNQVRLTVHNTIVNGHAVPQQ